MPSRNLKLPRRWIAPAILGAVTLLFFWRVFLLDQTIYAGDTAYVFVPFRQFLAHYLGAGKIPLWNPYLFGGTPALAESQYQVFYPINALLVVLGAARGMGWILAFHVAWMGLGIFLFLRATLGIGRLPALFGAIAFAFGASVQMRLGIPVYTNAAAWIPWILWGYERARRDGGAWMAAAPVALALQLCVGGAQYSYYTVVLLIGYHLFCLRRGASPQPGDRRRAWAALGWTFGASALLAMAQLLPELELALLSDRGANASYQFTTAGSLAPRHFLLVSLFPKFYGLYTSAPLDSFAASSESAYLGAATLALLGAASAFSSRAPLRFWAAGVLFSLFMALGENNPLYPLMYRFVPGVATFRGAGNWLVVTSFCCATLAAMGLHAILAGNHAARTRAFVVSVALLLIATGVLLSPLGATIYATPAAPFAPWLQVALFAVVAALMGLTWKMPVKFLSVRGLAVALTAVLVFDLFSVSQDMELNQTVLASDLATPPPAVERLKAVNNAVAPARFWSSSAPVPLEPWQVQQRLSPLETDAFRARQGLLSRSLMPSCVAAAYQMPGLTGAWGALMPLKRHPQPIYRNDTPLELKLRWLRLLGARYHLTYGAPLQSDWPALSTQPPAIYRDDKALPRAFWIGQVVPVTTHDALQTVNSPGFDPARQVALETSAVANSQSALPLRAATFARYDDARLELEIAAPAAGQLVLMDSFYPGWRARVDGRDTPIVPANFTGRAVAVGAGTHRVEMWFEPQSVRLGIFVSLLTLGLLAGVVGANWRKG